MSGIGYNVRMKFTESYGRLEEDDRAFDRAYWHRQGLEAIFDAAYGMIKDYLLLKANDADEPRLHRTVEAFGKVHWG